MKQVKVSNQGIQILFYQNKKIPQEKTLPHIYAKQARQKQKLAPKISRNYKIQLLVVCQFRENFLCACLLSVGSII